MVRRQRRRGCRLQFWCDDTWFSQGMDAMKTMSDWLGTVRCPSQQCTRSARLHASARSGGRHSVSIWHAGRSGPVDERRGHGGRACQRAGVLRRRQSVRDHLGLFPPVHLRTEIGRDRRTLRSTFARTYETSTHASTLARSLAHILTHAGTHVCTHTIARAHADSAGAPPRAAVLNCQRRRVGRVR